jgi:hypothetical protein
MKNAVLRQPGGIAPSPEHLREIVRAVALAGLSHQQREVPDRCRGDDCREVGMDGNRQRRAGLRLPDRERIVLDVLTADVHHIAAPLCGVESECQRKAGFRANRPVRLEGGNLGLTPTGETATLAA